MRGQAVARQTMVEPLAFDQPTVAAAMSSVREVEVEPVLTADPQGAIDRAIATLDREARGETEPRRSERRRRSSRCKAEPTLRCTVASRRSRSPIRCGRQEARARRADRRPERDGPRRAYRSQPVRRRRRRSSAPQADADRGGISALTIFLFVFVILLAGVGGAGFWAWREGYIDLDALFAPSAPAIVATDTGADSAPAPADTDTAAITGPGNTTASPRGRDRRRHVGARQQRRADRRRSAHRIAERACEPRGRRAARAARRLRKRPPRPKSACRGDASRDAADRRASDRRGQPGQYRGQPVAAARGRRTTAPPAPCRSRARSSGPRAPTRWACRRWSGKANIPARNLGVDLLIRKNSDPSCRRAI